MAPRAPFLERLMLGYAEILLGHRLWFALAAILLVASLAIFIPRITFDNTPDSFFLKNDATLAVYERFKDLFASDEYSLIVMKSPEHWTPEFIVEVRNLQQGLARLPDVRKVTSITNVRFIEGDEKAIDVGDFLQPGTTAAELAAKKATAQKHAYYSDLYISADGRYLGVVVETEIIKGQIDYKVALTQRIRSLLAQAPYNEWEPHAVGAPILDADVRDIVSKESGLFGGLVFVLVGIGFLYIFRSLIGVVLPLGIAILSMLSAFGIMGLIGAPVTLLTPIIPSFLISVGVGPTIFLMTAIYTVLREGVAPREAVIRSLRSAGLPSVMAAVTTASALLAFSSSRIAPVQDVGIVMGLALLVALVLSLVFVPIAFTLYRQVPPSKARDRMIGSRVRMLEALSGWVLARETLVLGATGALLVFAGMGVARLTVDYYYLGNFKEHTQIRTDYALVDESIRASSAIEVLVHCPMTDCFKHPAMLQALADLQDTVQRTATIPAQTYSLVNVVKEINQALHDGDPASYGIPETVPAVTQALLLFESSGSDELTRVASPDFDVARLTIRVPNLPDSAHRPLIKEIESASLKLFPPALLTEVGAPSNAAVVVTVTGLVPLWMKISGYLSDSQIQSVLISGAVVMLVMMLMFRSVLLGIVMTAANVLVIAIVLGTMGWVGIPLDPYTILIAAIALGILDDDTIHFVKHVQSEMQQGLSVPDAIRATYRSAGQAMLCMTAVLVCSFGLYFFSDVASLSKFGVLVAFTLLLGLTLEFFLTPTLLQVLDRFGMLHGHSKVVSAEVRHAGAP